MEQENLKQATPCLREKSGADLKFQREGDLILIVTHYINHECCSAQDKHLDERLTAVEARGRQQRDHRRGHSRIIDTA
jgi:hypothetical protein